MHKICTKCTVEQPLSEFYNTSNKCKTCTKFDVRENRLAKIDYYREYDRLRASMPHRKELAKRVQTEWKAEHPGRRKANVIVGNAVRDGKLTPLPCLVCGRKAEAHHPNYDAPLDVVWLCPPHHKQAHALARQIDKEQQK